ncbi:hypothetical protein DJ010_05035 [Nocardioides silvaticus]|uniref:Lipoprotein n=1 Tax=Nocardioides silvaticus TaxID=2201891 RepID=A0A316TVE8_9ACTN|nr:hypothetical protein [Nocardioides silvaticus]PWN03486.1 hypothetical protein DJ010_05035 [Nocardioides silvaticus]
MPSRAPRASRRAVLVSGGLAGAAAIATTLSGCGSADPGAADSAGAADPTAPAVGADSDLADRVAEHLGETLTLALSTGASFPALRPLTRRLVALHRAHLDEIGRPGDDISGGRVDGGAETARARLLRAEDKLQGRLVRAALEAESGALAQVLASMAAAVAQQRLVAS